jgi:hypothetical protein
MFSPILGPICSSLGLGTRFSSATESFGIWYRRWGNSWAIVFLQFDKPRRRPCTFAFWKLLESERTGLHATEFLWSLRFLLRQQHHKLSGTGYSDIFRDDDIHSRYIHIAFYNITVKYITWLTLTTFHSIPFHCIALRYMIRDAIGMQSSGLCEI